MNNLRERLVCSALRSLAPYCLNNLSAGEIATYAVDLADKTLAAMHPELTAPTTEEWSEDDTVEIGERAWLVMANDKPVAVTTSFPAAQQTATQTRLTVSGARVAVRKIMLY